MRNKELLQDGSGNFSRMCHTVDKPCPHCEEKMHAVFLDAEAVYEQLEEFMCQGCNHIEPQAVEYPRFMEHALSVQQGTRHYNDHKPY